MSREELQRQRNFTERQKTTRVLIAVAKERDRQEAICTEKQLSGLNWLTTASPWLTDDAKLAILTEEVGEVAKELCDARAENRPLDPNTRTELIQIAAIAVGWAESIPVPKETA